LLVVGGVDEYLAAELIKFSSDKISFSVALNGNVNRIEWQYGDDFVGVLVTLCEDDDTNRNDICEADI
jgi:hypothetical protein